MFRHLVLDFEADDGRSYDNCCKENVLHSDCSHNNGRKGDISVLCFPDQGCRAFVMDINPCCLPNDSSFVFDENTSVGQRVGDVTNSSLSNEYYENFEP